MKISDYISVEMLEKYEIHQSPIIFRGWNTREVVDKYWVETVDVISKKVDNLFKMKKINFMTDKEHK